jgi:hypothetical protein
MPDGPWGVLVGTQNGVLRAVGRVCPMVSLAQIVPLPQTNVWCRWQNVPYVKCMVNGVVALNGACDQAVHNKERCLSLSMYAAPNQGRATALRFRPLPNAANAAGSKGCAPYWTESSTRTSSEARSTFWYLSSMHLAPRARGLQEHWRSSKR